MKDAIFKLKNNEEPCGKQVRDSLATILSEVINSHFFGEDWASRARHEGEK